MLSSVKSFVKRNRTNIAIGVGLAGAAYVYARSKFSEAKDRMSSDRIAKENLKRRFEQNQDDCSYTVLELLPTAVDAIMRDMQVEKITDELRQKKDKKATKLVRSSTGAGEGSTAEASGTPTAGNSASKDDDNQSLQSFASESYIMANGFSVDQARRGKSRTQLWNEIKIGSITRAFTLIYTLALLTILTRVQLNLLGRKNYLSSVVSLAARDEDPTITLINNEAYKSSAYSEDEVNRQYLIFSWWFLHKGWRRVRDKVEAAVKEVFGPYTPRDTFTLAQLHELTGRVRTIIEIDQGAKWITSFLLPTRAEERIVFTESGYTQQPIPSSSAGPSSSSAHESVFQTSPALRKMLDETSDLLDSPIAAVVMRTMLDTGFGILVDEKMTEQVFKKPAPPTPAAATADGKDGLAPLPTISITEPEKDEVLTTKLASILAVITREAQSIGSRGPNEYLKQMEQAKELEGFSALVYSNFEDVAAQLPASAYEDSGSERLLITR